MAWAATAGVTTTARLSRIEELLCSHETFVEELFDALLDELGFPACATIEPSLRRTWGSA
ncbi:hypothetical protein ACIBI4_09240 [Streptomyces sp. NPDC050418]|uniref:hypothetical protein n=1 Tax=Streptomyces sp. NPDC050418 TaxID=3365612 RepID=UPI0037B07C87